MRKVFVGLFMLCGAVSAFAGPAGARDTGGAVYVASNAAAGNEILVFDRDARGALSLTRKVATGGAGTSGGLSNQSGLLLSADGRWLIAVNAGSHDVSVFRASGSNLALASRTSSGGQRPVSVTLYGDLVYVLNAGGVVGATDNIAGFRLDESGGLHPLPNAIQPLSGPNTEPAQVTFTSDGRFLAVTERATNLIGLFEVSRGHGGVEEDGVAGPGTFYPSAGITPFGFAVDRRGRLYVAEAAGGSPNASSLSSYELTEDGSLQVISPSVPTTQSATCWVVISQDGRSAFTTNTGSGTVSAYEIDPTGALTLRDGGAIAGNTGPDSAPADAALSAGGVFLYTRNGGNNTISVFRVNTDGTLTGLSTFGGLPGGANGLAAR